MQHFSLSNYRSIGVDGREKVERKGGGVVNSITFDLYNFKYVIKLYDFTFRRMFKILCNIQNY